jgi:hypothetical protein
MTAVVIGYRYYFGFETDPGVVALVIIILFSFLTYTYRESGMKKYYADHLDRTLAQQREYIRANTRPRRRLMKEAQKRKNKKKQLKQQNNANRV